MSPAGRNPTTARRLEVGPRLYRLFRLTHKTGRWFHRRFTTAGQLALGATLASGVVGIDTRQTLAYQIFTLGASILSLSAGSALFFRSRFRAQRELPRYATVDELLNYRIKLHNLGNRTERGLLLREEPGPELPTRQELRAAVEPDAPRRNWFDQRVGYPLWEWLISHKQGFLAASQPVPDLAPRSEVEVEMNLKPQRRGYVRLPGLAVYRPDPFGLFKSIAPIPSPQTLLVLPKRYPVSALNLTGGRHFQPGGVSLAGSVGDAEEFVSLREYRPGDPVRHIHWRSWARTGKPIVKEFQEEFFVRYALMLDTFAEGTAVSLFEEAVSVAASFAAALTQHETLLDLMFVGTEAYRFTAGRGVNQTAGMLEILACVQPAAEAEFRELEDLMMAHTGELSGAVCVMLRWDEPRRGLVARLRQRGIATRVYVLSDLEEILDPGPLQDDGAHFRVLTRGRIEQHLGDA